MKVHAGIFTSCDLSLHGTKWVGVGWGQSSVVLNPKTLAESRIHHPLSAWERSILMT